MTLSRAFRHLVSALAAAAGLLLVAGCQAQAPAASGAAAASPVDAESALLARIRGEIGDARCDSDAQCRTVGIGEKACGGPATYYAWSGPAARGEKLKAWSAELAALQRKRAAASGMVSNCQFMPDPGAVCVQQRCVLRVGGAGGMMAN